jgi:hypothetical protein
MGFFQNLLQGAKTGMDRMRIGGDEQFQSAPQPGQYSGAQQVDAMQKAIGSKGFGDEGGFNRASGDEVMNLQRGLKEMGLYKGELDGMFGPKSLDALRRFQSARGETSPEYDQQMDQTTQRPMGQRIGQAMDLDNSGDLGWGDIKSGFGRMGSYLKEKGGEFMDKQRAQF